ncbi:carboxypeptidase regulatory-like domain-containing protein [Chloroflexota bacterium]
MSSHLKRAAYVLLIVGLLVGSAPVAAQRGATGANPISYGDTVTGTVLRPDGEHWEFSGVSGDVVDITMDSTSGDVDPYLVLYGPEGHIEAWDDDSGGGGDARIRTLTLPSTGAYTIRAARRSGTGDYQLTLTLEAASPQTTPRDDEITATPVVVPPDWDETSQLIDAETGGTVQLDNFVLSVPAGALMADTEITISHPEGAPDLGDAGMAFISLEPSGVQLDLPLEMTVSYNQPLTFDEELLSAWTANVDTGMWEALSVLHVDTANNVLQIEIPHFSYLFIFPVRPLDLVLELSGEHLRKGDLIFTLAKAGGIRTWQWLPGHVGMYLGTDNAASKINDTETIIESTPVTDTSFFCLDDGVILSTLDDFIDDPDHLYMGARRLPGLSDGDRQTIAAYALSQRGVNYSMVARVGWKSGSACFSCVGLTESAYDDANRSIIEDSQEFPFGLPITQYKNTEPVRDVSVQEGKWLRLIAKAVIWDDSDNQYRGDSSVVTISNCPSGALGCGPNYNGHFDWKPTEADIGNYDIHVQASATVYGLVFTDEYDVTIHVYGSGTGTIEGYVTDARTGQAAHGATVGLEGMERSASTDGDGYYVFQNVNAGSYTLTASKEGYVPVSVDRFTSDGETVRADFSLSPPGLQEEIRVVLTWGAEPMDLDSHLRLPPGSPYHVWYADEGSLSSLPFAALDVDDVSSYGPETITVVQRQPGRYVYAVHNFSGSPDITTSEAVVRVYRGENLVQTYSVPTSGAGTWWHVFDIDSSGNIITRDFILDEMMQSLKIEGEETTQGGSENGLVLHLREIESLPEEPDADHDAVLQVSIHYLTLQLDEQAKRKLPAEELWQVAREVYFYLVAQQNGSTQGYQVSESLQQRLVQLGSQSGRSSDAYEAALSRLQDSVTRWEHNMLAYSEARNSLFRAMTAYLSSATPEGSAITPQGGSAAAEMMLQIDRNAEREAPSAMPEIFFENLSGEPISALITAFIRAVTLSAEQGYGPRLPAWVLASSDSASPDAGGYIGAQPGTTLSTAFRVQSPWTYYAIASQDAWVFFSVDLSQGEELSISLAGPSETDFDLYWVGEEFGVSRAAKDILSHSANLGSSESLRLVAARDARFYFGVYSHRGVGQFDLTFEW